MANTATIQPNKTLNQAAPKERKPNESGTISVQAHMKIFDPNSNKVYVEGRA